MHVGSGLIWFQSVMHHGKIFVDSVNLHHTSFESPKFPSSGKHITFSIGAWFVSVRLGVKSFEGVVVNSPRR